MAAESELGAWILRLDISGCCQLAMLTDHARVTVAASGFGKVRSGDEIGHAGLLMVNCGSAEI